MSISVPPPPTSTSRRPRPSFEASGGWLVVAAGGVATTIAVAMRLVVGT